MAKKERIEKELSLFHKRFIDTWFNLNFNATLAYKQLKPNVATSTAESEASKILGSSLAKEYIELKQEQIRIKEDIKLSFIVQELTNIVLDIKQETIERDDNGRITSKPDRANSIKALQQLSKIGGFEATKKVDVTTNGQSLNLKDLINFKKTDE